MLSIEHNKIKYHRIVTDNFYEDKNEELLKNFNYSFVISYGDFVSKSYDVVDKNAVIIKLDKGIDSVFSKFHAKVRTHTRRFEKLDELTFHKKIPNKTDFYDFYTECEHSRGWKPVPEDEIFKSIIFYVCHNGIPISGISAYTCENKIRLGRIFSLRNTTDIDKANLVFGVAAKKIIYEFCVFGVENNFDSLDLGGIDLTSDKKSGVTYFKLSFSDNIVPVKIGRFVKAPDSYSKMKKEFSSSGLDLT
jgi:hypothetical protein